MTSERIKLTSGIVSGIVKLVRLESRQQESSFRQEMLAQDLNDLIDLAIEEAEKKRQNEQVVEESDDMLEDVQ